MNKTQLNNEVDTIIITGALLKSIQLNPLLKLIINNSFNSDETQIVNNLTTGGATKIASAETVKSLKTILDQLVINDFITGGVTKAFSAEKGKELKILVDTKVEQSAIDLSINNLKDGVDVAGNTLNKLYVLYQGLNTLLQSDNVNLDNVQELVDAIETVQTSLATILVDDLITGGVTKALTAQQGVVLKGLIDALTSSKEDVSNKQNDLSASATKYPTVDAVRTIKQSEKQLMWNGSHFLTGNYDENPFVGTAIGSSGVGTQSPLDVGFLGVLTLISGATANSGNVFQTRCNHIGTVGETFFAVFKTPAVLTNTLTRIGLSSSTTSADAVNGAGYLEIVAGVCSFKTALSSVRTIVPSITMTVDTWYKLIIERTATASVTFTILDLNDVVLSTTEINTNVPVLSANSYRAGLVSVKINNGAATTLHIDYMGIGLERPIGLKP